MRVREVPALGMWRVASGRRDPFLHRRRINWGTAFGWAVLLSAGALWGLLLALLVRGAMVVK